MANANKTKHGRKTKDELISFRIPSQERALLEAIAMKEDRSLSSIMRLVIREYVSKSRQI